MSRHVKAVLLLILMSLIVSCAAAPARKMQPAYSMASYTNYIIATEAEVANDWEKALKYIRLALQEDPDSPFLKIELSTILMQMKRVDEAIASARGILVDKPDYEPALSLLARIYTSKKDYGNAAEMYRKLIEIDPSEVKSYLHLAYIYSLSGDRSLSLDALKDAVALAPYNGMARYYLGRMLVEGKEFEKAIEHLAKAVEVNQNFTDAYYLLGIAYEAVKDNDNAINSYEKYLTMNASSIEVRKRLARLYFQKGLVEKVIHQLSEISRAEPGNLKIAEMLVNMYVENKQFARAESELRKIIDDDPENKNDMYARARIL